MEPRFVVLGRETELPRLERVVVGREVLRDGLLACEPREELLGRETELREGLLGRETEPRELEPPLRWALLPREVLPREVRWANASSPTASMAIREQTMRSRLLVRSISGPLNGDGSPG